MKRLVNKKIEFEGVTLLIPENTRLNPKHGNIVDEKTGYGIALAIKRDSGCTSGVFYTKKIIKANGCTKNCK